MPQSPTHDHVAWFLDESGWTTNNINSAISTLNRWHRWLTKRKTDVLDATTTQCREYIKERGASGIAPATNRCDWRYLKAFYEWAAMPASQNGAALIERSPMLGVKAPKVPEGGVQKTATVADYQQALDACTKTREPHRNRAMVALMFKCGLRASEVLSLDMDDIHLAGNGPLTHPHLYIANPKNDKPRNVPVPPEAATFIRRYLRTRVGQHDGPLFTGTVNTRSAGGRLTYSALRGIFRRADIAVPAHAFRRGMATDFLLGGKSQLSLQRICGWSDARMAARYAEAGLDELAAQEMFAHHAETDERTDRRRARKNGNQVRFRAKASAA